MKSRSFLPLGLLAALLAGCASPAGRAAKRDVATVQRENAAADADMGKAQDANAQLAADNARLGQNNAALKSDARRIDDKAVVLLNSKWAP